MAPAKGDWRFTGPTWNDNPLYRRIGQAYLSFTESMDRLVDETEKSGKDLDKARFAITLLTSAAAITVPVFATGAMTDHLTPWKGSYRTTQLLSGPMTFVLSNSGHIQSLVNPPGNPKASYHTGPPPGHDPDQWLATATRHAGSWREAWADWITPHSRAERPALQSLGSPAFEPITEAPGDYVRQALGP